METLLDHAKKGKLVEEIKIVSEKEGIEERRLLELISNGRVIIPKNFNRGTAPIGIGESLSTKINANIGTSKDFIDMDYEVKKAKIALKYGADTIMDLSTGGDLDEIRRRIIKETKAPIGTVPIYQAGLERKAVVEMTSDDMFNATRKHAKDGVDFATVHVGVNRNSLERLIEGDRILGVVSRGGAFTIAWMIQNGEDNPFYKEFDYLIEIAREYDLTLSLGDGMRSGCIDDATDRPKFAEFITLGELSKRARKQGVQTMIEGPGHVPLDEIGVNVKAMKKLADGAPLYLLGPLPTDIAPGYDHIVGAIGGSIAGYYGADFLCMITPSEHLALPTVEDIKDGTIVAKIAAHVADTVKANVKERAREWDRKMAYAREDLDWEKQFDLAIDGEFARRFREDRNTESDACSMCGDICAIKMVKDALSRNHKIR
ncbi:MAG: phosphomethylpyrimidine synthase ThiC [Candidatus Methanolliviera hydrocarbonicum]|jgi:hydroxymethylpyrimidine synthase|uniref:Phosphomethylpyrimidine synthase n=1 Tax=Candidatus Methanolliviera hydrocarbonicum TaxID=2491085 RepID=A0A520KWB1_9EURY|nr:MAG: phosphomethylpyrimidine synthase ThiC [Candidatus Methanolliviera hydrocarbonicum]